VKVRYTLPALADLAEILDYVAARSPQSAARVQSRIKSFTDLLPAHPFIGTRKIQPSSVWL
jgi:plasmid stabilization system protein ParE